MMNKIFFIIFSYGLINASILTNKIENFIGQKEYKTHSRLINNIFHNKSSFIVNDQINYLKVFKLLRSNGLMNLKLDKAQKINISFKVKDNYLNAYKILYNSIQSLGYRHVITKSLQINDNNEMQWIISFKTEYMLNSYLLIKELKKNNCKVEDIVKDGNNHWIYKLNFNNSYISTAKSIPSYERIIFSKPLNPIFVKIKNNKNIEIISRVLNRWHPHIIFYDKNLQNLKIYKGNAVSKKLKMNIPNETKYIMISDIYNLVNIKRGLTVIVR